MKSRKRSHRDEDELLSVILFRIFRVIILLETRVDGLGRNTVKGRDLLYGLAAVLHRADSFYILAGELALTGGGMVVNRFLGRLVLVDIVRINIDG